MLIAELLLAGVAAAAPAQTPSTPTPRVEAARVYSNTPAAADACRGGQLSLAAGKPAPPPARRLADLPKANFELTVNRRIGPCQVPVIVSYGVGK